MSAGQALKQGAASLLDEGMDTLEAVPITAIGVRDLAQGGRRPELIEQQADLCAVGRPQERANVREVLRVHREDLVEAIEVGGAEVSRPLRGQVNAPATRDRLRDRVRRLSDVPSPRARRRDLDAVREAGSRDERAEDALCDRRATDVAQTDELDPQRLRHSFFQPPRA